MPRSLLVRVLCLPLMACLMLPVATQAQDQPVIAVTDLSLVQFAQDFLRKAQAKEAEQARLRAAAAPNAPKNAPAPAKDKNPENELAVGKDELNRFGVDIKGELFKSGVYRLLPGKIRQSTNKEALPDIMAQIASGMYPDIDYVLFGTISYINTLMASVPTGNKQITHTLSMDMVGEFALINTRTRTIDAAFSSLGHGADTHVAKSAGTVIAINKSKILKQASQSLANAVVAELELQLTPTKIKAGTTPIVPANSTPLTRTITIK